MFGLGSDPGPWATHARHTTTLYWHTDWIECPSTIKTGGTFRLAFGGRHVWTTGQPALSCNDRGWKNQPTVAACAIAIKRATTKNLNLSIVISVVL